MKRKDCYSVRLQTLWIWSFTLGNREYKVFKPAPLKFISLYEDQPRLVYPNENGVITIEINELERIEMHLSEGNFLLADGTGICGRISIGIY